MIDSAFMKDSKKFYVKNMSGAAARTGKLAKKIGRKLLKKI